jgi:MFS family permease
VGAILLNVPIGFFLYTATDPSTVFALLLINVSLSSAYIAPTIATTQRLVDANSRALASAVLFFVMSFIGLTIGPWLTGHISDTFKDIFLSEGIDGAQASADGLRYAFICMLAAPTLASVFYLLSARHMRAELVA